VATGLLLYEVFRQQRPPRPMPLAAGIAPEEG
jgi:hypothetical protein